MRPIDINLEEVIKKYRKYTDSDFIKSQSRSETVCLCPVCGRDSEKFTIYDKTSEGKGFDYHCFYANCNVGGNIFNLYRDLKIAMDAKEIEEKINEDFGLQPPDKWNVALFAEYKNLKLDTLVSLGWETTQNGILIPYYNIDGVEIARKIRCNKDSKVRFYFESGKTDIFAVQTLKSCTDLSVLYITEGESDCVTMLQAGFNAVGIGGAKAWKAEYAEILSRFDKIVLTMDNDNAGEGLLASLVDSFEDKLYVLKLPRNIKDVNDFHRYVCFGDVEYFKADFKKLKVLPATATTFLAEVTKNKELLSDRDAVNAIKDILSDPIVKEDLIANISKATKITKSTLKDIFTISEIDYSNLEDWYYPTKTGVGVNPERFAEHLAKTEHILKLSDSKKTWLIYDGNGCYKRVDETAIHHIIKTKMRKDCSCIPKNIKDTLFYLETHHELNVPADEFDNDKNILNLKNGLLDLTTMQIHPHSPKHLSLRKLNVSYKPDIQKSEAFTQYLDSKLPDLETRSIVQEMLGYSISSYTNAEKFFLIQGKGRSGKGTLLSIVTKMLGAENVSNVKLQDIGERFFPAQFFGKLANIQADLPSNPIKEASVAMLKSIIGRDNISTEFKNQDGFSFECKAKMIFSCNKLPPNTGDNEDSSFTSKIVLIKMNHSDTVNVDTTMKDRLLEDANLDAVFLWALEGLKRLIANDFRFSTSEDSKQLKREYQELSASFIQFLNEYCKVGAEYVERRSRVYDVYRKWCDSEANKRVKNINDGMRSANDYFFDGEEVIKAVRMRRHGDTNPQWYVFGIEIESDI